MGKYWKIKDLVPIKKEVPKIDEDINGSFETISSKRKRIDGARFVASSLSNLVDNFIEGIHKSKLKDCWLLIVFFNMKEQFDKI